MFVYKDVVEFLEQLAAILFCCIVHLHVRRWTGRCLLVLRVPSTVELERFRKCSWNCTMYFKVSLCKTYLPCLHINDTTTITYGWHVYDNIISCQSHDISWRFSSPFSKLNINRSRSVAFGLGPLYGLLNDKWFIVSFNGNSVPGHKLCS